MLRLVFGEVQVGEVQVAELEASLVNLDHEMDELIEQHQAVFERNVLPHAVVIERDQLLVLRDQEAEVNAREHHRHGVLGCALAYLAENNFRLTLLRENIYYVIEDFRHLIGYVFAILLLKTVESIRDGGGQIQVVTVSEHERRVLLLHVRQVQLVLLFLDAVTHQKVRDNVFFHVWNSVEDKQWNLNLRHRIIESVSLVALVADLGALLADERVVAVAEEGLVGGLPLHLDVQLVHFVQDLRLLDFFQFLIFQLLLVIADELEQ